MDQEDFNEALYNGACSTMKMRSYGDDAPTTPDENKINKLRTQLRRVLELCPGHLTVTDLLELL